jgi:hypothetical protein
MRSFQATHTLYTFKEAATKSLPLRVIKVKSFFCRIVRISLIPHLESSFLSLSSWLKALKYSVCLVYSEYSVRMAREMLKDPVLRWVALDGALKDLTWWFHLWVVVSNWKGKKWRRINKFVSFSLRCFSINFYFHTENVKTIKENLFRESFKTFFHIYTLSIAEKEPTKTWSSIRKTLISL